MDEKRGLGTNNNAGIETDQKKQQTVFANNNNYVSLDVFVYEV